jgi:hypothetical protein
MAEPFSTSRQDAITLEKQASMLREAGGQMPGGGRQKSRGQGPQEAALV